MANVSQETMMFKRNREKVPVEQTIREVCAALEEKGYNPKDQLVGYLLSGDPTYITSHKDARAIPRTLPAIKMPVTSCASTKDTNWWKRCWKAIWLPSGKRPANL